MLKCLKAASQQMFLQTVGVFSLRLLSKYYQMQNCGIQPPTQTEAERASQQNKDCNQNHFHGGQEHPQGLHLILYLRKPTGSSLKTYQVWRTLMIKLWQHTFMCHSFLPCLAYQTQLLLSHLPTTSSTKLKYIPDKARNAESGLLLFKKQLGTAF